MPKDDDGPFVSLILGTILWPDSPEPAPKEDDK